eukprot:IDg19645t1
MAMRAATPRARTGTQRAGTQRAGTQRAGTQRALPPRPVAGDDDHDSKSRTFVEGVVVWAKVEGFPWWPAVVRLRSRHERKLLPEERAVLPPSSAHNRLVEFFNDANRVAVVALLALEEFSSHMHLQSTTADPVIVEAV